MTTGVRSGILLQQIRVTVKLISGDSVVINEKGKIEIIIIFRLSFRVTKI